MSDVHDIQMVRSVVAHLSQVDEAMIDELIDDMGKLPTKYFDVQIIVTVVVTPLPDEVNFTVGQCPN